MRARLLAFLTLILLIAIPAGIYYYFTTKQISRITVSAGTGSIFAVHLAGTFGVDGLPLADRVLSYDRSCISICTLAPILPARYTLTLTSSGKIDIIDTIIVGTADTIVRSYGLTDDVIFDSVGQIEDIGDISSGSLWHIRTETGSYTTRNNILIEDIRFTDAIDLTPQIRLGYIDKNDTAKLSIGNFSLGQSVLVRLDRTTGESTIVRKGLDIGAFFYYKNKPAYRDSVGEVFLIK